MARISMRSFSATSLAWKSPARYARAALAGTALTTASAAAAITIDGHIQPDENWLLLTEARYARPVQGGQADASDAAAETSTFHWWDGILLRDVPMRDNRGDIVRILVSADDQNLYLAVAGPTGPFNRFNDQSPGASNDVADLFIALDLDAAAGSLAAGEGHDAFGQKAVDFLNWRPDVVVGVQFVDNGGGGGGRAVVQTLGVPPLTRADAPQGAALSGLLWNATINGSAAYDPHNQNAGEFEFAIAWSALGLSARPELGARFRVSAYTTQNFGGSDVYDSAPGIGNGSVHEELGDCPGDPDSGGLLQACNPGSAFGSTAAANFSVIGAGPIGPDDDSDTIEEYLVFIPLPRRGDMNCDGVVNFDDIDGFVAALVGYSSYAAAYPDCYWLNGDMNCTNDANFDDIDGFVACLAGGGACPDCP